MGSLCFEKLLYRDNGGENGNDYNESYLGFRAYGLGSSRLRFFYRGSQGCIGSRGISGEADGNTMEIYTEAEVKWRLHRDSYLYYSPRVLAS